MALALLRGRDSAWQTHPGKPPPGLRRQRHLVQLSRVCHQCLVAQEGHQILRHRPAYLYGGGPEARPQWGFFGKPETDTGLGRWNDLSGLLLPATEEHRLIEDIKDGTLDTIHDVIERFEQIHRNYRVYQWTWTYRLILDHYGIKEISEQDDRRIKNDYVEARRAWVAEIKKDAEKEYAMGDVECEVYEQFINQLDHEVDYEGNGAL